ncbi:hypothetical protein AAF712_013187 [Marasmius tenuissimus]|uniref:YTH domain-containing protein n=1 Tax=Marasmius tenuissimus TaxID=585030 RepID=A0ABR2ZG88_9AGAR
MASLNVLARSVDTGVWTSQNESFEVELEQASRTSSEVFLIIAAEKKNEFWGYAKIAGTSRLKMCRSPSPLGLPVVLTEPPQIKIEEDFSSPVQGSPSSSSALVTVLDDSAHPATSKLSVPANPPRSPTHLPPVSGDETPRSPPNNLGESNSSPINILHQRPEISVIPPPYNILDTGATQEFVESPLAISDEEDSLGQAGDMVRGTSEAGCGRKRSGGRKTSSHGELTVDWICTDHLPYSRTRHIRNPWDHDREVKFSDDGHELEPGIGQQLIDEWQRYIVEQRAGPNVPHETPLLKLAVAVDMGNSGQAGADVTATRTLTAGDREFKSLVEELQAILEDNEQRQQILRKQGDDAQAWLDLFQLVADSPGISPPLRSTIFKAMLRLSKDSGRYPKCLVIQNAEKQGNRAVGGGGFGDVWKGTIGRPGSVQTVCLKVVKVNVLITPSGRACIADFGLSRVADPEVLRITSSTSRALGSVRWLAPELLEAESIPTKDSNRPSRAATIPVLSNAILWNLMEACWQTARSARPDASTVVHVLIAVSPAPLMTAPAWPDSMITGVWNNVDHSITNNALTESPSPLYIRGTDRNKQKHIWEGERATQAELPSLFSSSYLPETSSRPTLTLRPVQPAPLRSQRADRTLWRSTRNPTPLSARYPSFRVQESPLCRPSTAPLPPSITRPSHRRHPFAHVIVDDNSSPGYPDDPPSHPATRLSPPPGVSNKFKRGQGFRRDKEWEREKGREEIRAREREWETEAGAEYVGQEGLERVRKVELSLSHTLTQLQGLAGERTIRAMQVRQARQEELARECDGEELAKERARHIEKITKNRSWPFLACTR